MNRSTFNLAVSLDQLSIKNSGPLANQPLSSRLLIYGLYNKVVIFSLILSLIACSSAVDDVNNNGDGGGNEKISNSAPVARDISITDDNGGTPLVGTTLTGSYTYSDADSDAEGDSIFQWISGTTPIPGANSKSYTITTADVDQIIYFVVTPKASSGANPGTPASASVTVGNSRPIANNVSISGTPLIVGAQLTGTYTYNDIDGDEESDSIFRWYRDDIEIAGINTDTYIVSAIDSGKEISFEVTPKAAAGTSPGEPVVSAALKINNSAPVASNVSITDDNDGNIIVGTTLTGVYTYIDIDEDLEGVSTFRWLQGGRVIDGADSTFYTLTTDDSGKNISFEVTPNAATGVTSGNPASTTVMVKNSAPIASNVIITNNNNDILVEGTLLTGNYVYNDLDNDGEGNTTFRWLRNGSALVGNTSSTYRVSINDISQTISFEVTARAITGVSPGATIISDPVTINSAPVATNINITSSTLPLEIGTILTGNYTYNDIDLDAEGVTTYSWLRNGLAIEGATNITYTLTNIDIGQAIQFEVKPAATIGTSPGSAGTSPPAPYVKSLGDSIGGLPRAVAIQGDFVYLAADGVLLILDVSNPANPLQVAHHNTPGLAHDVAVSGNYAYVADYNGGLRVIDISDPAAPVEVSSLIVSLAWGIAISGNFAYVTSWGLGELLVIDISDPTNPKEIGIVATDGDKSIAINGNYAYVTGDGKGLRIINISNPALPTEVGSFVTPGFALGVEISGDYAYIAEDNNGLRIINISNPALPIEVGLFDTPGSASGVAKSGNYAYVADNYDGLQIINISNPATPTSLGSIDTPGRAWNVTIKDTYAYVADYTGGLRVININNPATPQEVGSFNPPGSAQNTAISGDFVYVAATSGLHTFDVSNPRSPIDLGISNPAGAQDVFVSNSYAYVVSTSGFHIIDVSNPFSQNEIGYYYLNGGANGVALHGDYAYVSSETWGLSIIRISNPATPEFVGYIRTPGTTHSVAISSNYAYLADDTSGVRVININDPTAPSEVGFVDTPGSALDVDISGNYAYVADDNGGLRIINITDPANPVEVAMSNTPGFSQSVAISGNYAYLADGLGRLYPDLSTGLSIINISDPNAPYEVGSSATPGIALGIAVNGNFAYVADNGAGLKIFEFIAP